MKSTVPMLHTTHIDVLRDFYIRLGFELTGSWEPDGELRWVSLNFDGAEIMIQKTKEDYLDRSKPDITLYFICLDVDDLYRIWVSKGIPVTKPPDEFYGMRQIFVRDPNGRFICFEQDIRRTTPNADVAGV